MSEAGQGLSLAFAADALTDVKENTAQNLRSRMKATLTWMITQLEFQKANNELYAGDSPELKEAKELLEELEND